MLEAAVGKAEAAVKELDALTEQLGKAETDEARKELETKLQAKSAEADRLMADVERAKSVAVKRDVLATARAALKTDTKGKDLAAAEAESNDPEKKAALEAKDHAKHDAAIEGEFFSYLRGKDISDIPEKLRTEMTPDPEKFPEGSAGLKAPHSLAKAIFGERWGKAMARGKEILSTDTSAGSLIPQDYRAQLLELTPEPTHILGMATIIPSTTGAVVWPRMVQTDTSEYGGVSFSWISEGGSKPETEPEFEQITINTHEIAGYTEISLRMLSRSAINLEQLLARLYRDAMRAELDYRFLNGSGTGEPNGAINEAGIRTQARVTAGAVGYTDLVRLKHQIRSYHRPRCNFMLHDDVEQGLELLTDTGGKPLFNASVASGPYDRLVGYPYIVGYRQPALGSDGDVIYGDWSEYIVAMEQDVVIKRSDHYKFRNNLAAFVCYAVVGGRLVQPRAMAILEAGES